MATLSIIQHWNPEDRVFWAQAGQHVARRNLWLSIPALTLAFAVWMLWSALVVQLPAAGFHYSTNQLFWLTALPALSGATLRVIYAFAVRVLGGRRFTALATASLLLPAIGIGLAVQDPGTPYEWMLMLALLCGLGGGNFASSMAHLSRFYPRAQKGTALGLNAGFGHLGVALVQAVVPLVVGIDVFGALGGAPQAGTTGPLWLQNAGYIWAPLIIASAAAAWFGMDDLADVKAGFAEQAVIFTRRHNWLMCWLVLGSLGSTVGYSAGLPLLLQSQFPRSGLLHLAWLGPLLAALVWPLGRWLAERCGAARITFWVFVVLALGASAALLCLPGSSSPAGDGAALLLCFGLLFLACGIGNGSTFCMITTLFVTAHQQAAEPLPSAQRQASHEGQAEAAAVLGFACAIGAYGGFFIPKSYGSSMALTGSPAAALQLFITFYLSCIALTWWQYSRRHAPFPC